MPPLYRTGATKGNKKETFEKREQQTIESAYIN